MSTPWMRAVVVTAAVVCLSPVAASQQSGQPLAQDERAALAALEQPQLEASRAASAREPQALSQPEHESLALAQARHAELAEQRAGELSDHDIKLILGTAAVVIVIALLL
jgi:hypothetical protein